MDAKPIVLPIVIKYEEQAPVKVDSETTIALLMYYIENHRKKPGLLRRTGERIKHVTILYQPLVVLEIGNRQAVIVDPTSSSRLVIEYVEPLFNNVREYYRQLESSRGKDFIDILVRLRNHLKDLVSKKRDVLRRRYELEGVVSDREVLDELTVFLTLAPGEYMRGYNLPYREVDLAYIKNSIEDLLARISNAVNQVNDLLLLLDKTFESWRQLLVSEYDKRLEEVYRELEETRRIVDSKIMELKERMNQELGSVEENYRKLIENTRRNLESIEVELRQLYEEQRRRQAYGGDVKEVKKKISSLEKRRKELNKEYQQLLKKLDSERDSIRKKYEKLIDAEMQRIRVIENEIKRLNRERDNLIAHAREDVDEVKRMFLKINDYVLSVKKRVENFLVPLPPSGQGYYLLPFTIAVYEKTGSERTILVPPLYYRVKKGLIKRTSLTESQKIKGYLERYNQIYFDSRYKNEIIKNDLFPTISVERIEYALRRVAEEGLLPKNRVAELVKSLQEQLEIAITK